jgi:hypothetical protein
VVGGTNGVVPFDAAPPVDELLELLELDDELCDPLDELLELDLPFTTVMPNVSFPCVALVPVATAVRVIEPVFVPLGTVIVTGMKVPLSFSPSRLHPPLTRLQVGEIVVFLDVDSLRMVFVESAFVA